MLKRLLVKRRARRGQSMVEFALVLLPLIISLLAIVEFAFLMFSWVLIEHAAREGLRVAITGGDTSGNSPASDADRLTAIQAAVLAASAGLPRAETDITIVLNSWDDNTFTTAHSGSISGSGTPAISGDPGLACYAVEVEVDYTYKPVVPFFQGIQGSFTMTARERGLNEQFAGCGS